MVAEAIAVVLLTTVGKEKEIMAGEELILRVVNGGSSNSSRNSRNRTSINT